MSGQGSAYALRMRIVEADHFPAPTPPELQALCTPPRSGSSWHPVVRLYGVTESGMKVCMHVHGFYPYLYVPWTARHPPDQAYLAAMATGISETVHRALARDGSVRNEVHAIDLEERLEYYGYHDRRGSFLRVQLLNPVLKPRITAILQSVSTCCCYYSLM